MNKVITAAQTDGEAGRQAGSRNAYSIFHDTSVDEIFPILLLFNCVEISY